jgi:hypothetical protein
VLAPVRGEDDFEVKIVGRILDAAAPTTAMDPIRRSTPRARIMVSSATA